ncbi:deoxycytidyl transferase [Saccharomyces paradoxus]|uniref:DNA repair protein REV1 n=1 Tax=Saccharomyces paradoxus TaxID=27291 RepID=A0A8B8V0F4_SACPA|nr:Rev1 [Saccharomyces paradoxus]QHS76421.1 Rev1 [Saccharomyces paradoxus]
MGEYDEVVDLLDSDLEYSINRKTPDKENCFTQSSFNDSHLTGRTGGLNARSFLSTLSDDSLIEYVNQLSQTNKSNSNLTAGTPRFTTEHISCDDLHADLSCSEDSPIAHSVTEIQESGSNNEDVNKNTVYTRENYFQDKAQGQSLQDQMLRDQYKDQISSQSSKVFKNCVIYINGYTKPGRLQLHEMIVLHGGKFLHYLSSKKTVTHIVASNLPLKKRIEFANYKVVSPDWIIDSIKEARLVPWQNYSLTSKLDEQQKKLDNCKTVNSIPLPSKTTLHKRPTHVGWALLPVEQPSLADLNNLESKRIVACDDPNFLTSYFAHSRLHHLSAWKANLKDKFLNEHINRYTKITNKDTYTIFHIDFDCFFATVAYLCRSACFSSCDFKRDPIVVCHGTKNSDIASCNYVARSYGIKNGMWVSQAEKMLPNGIKLTSLPYNFEQFQLKSEAFYSTLKGLNIFNLILPISIDEAVCARVISDDIHNTKTLNAKLCEEIRQEVFQGTDGCTVSIGCSDSLVLARLALKVAKPNGYNITFKSDLSEKFWCNFKLDDLPGVGRSILSRLESTFHSPHSLNDLRKRYTLDTLKASVGSKLGMKIHLALQGQDDEESLKILYDPKEVLQRKSLSIDINWGIRFGNITQVDLFIERGCQYLLKKLNEINKTTSQITLKLMRRCKDAPIEPPKYMGMGRCDSFSRSSRLGIPTNEFGIIATEMKSLYRTLGCPPKELRGLALQFNKLVDVGPDNNQLKLRLPFKTIVTNKAFESLPDDVKNDINNEFEKRIYMRKESGLDSSLLSSKKKGITIPRPEAHDLPSTMEEQFMSELPTQVRAEVRHDLRIQKKIQRTKLGNLQEKIKRREESLQNEKIHFMGHNSIFKPIKFQNLTRFKKICQLVKQWVAETLGDGGPHEKDVKLFVKYLIKLCDSNRVHLVLHLSNLISRELNLRASLNQDHSGFQTWERILLNDIIPLLNRNKHTYQTVRKLDMDFEV